MKTLYITGNITITKFNKFSRQLRFQENKGINGRGAVRVELCSEGGDTYAALAFHDRIRTSPLDIHVVVYGPCFSAALLILAAGDKRLMGTSAWAMTHEDSSSLEDMTVKELEDYASHSRDLENQWNKLLAARSNVIESNWARLAGRDSYLTAQQCLDYGIIDEVLK